MHHSWSVGFDRIILGVVSVGGLFLGFLLLALWQMQHGLPALLVGLASLAVGSAALVTSATSGQRSIPFLVAVPVLVGLLAPFIDRPLALALDAVLVAVLATGMLVIRSLRRMWAFALLVVAAAAVDPVLETVGVADHAMVIPSREAVVSSVLLIALMATAASFRALRKLLVRREEFRREKDEFVSAVAHHLRTPLTVVVGFSHILAAELDGDHERDFAFMILSRAWEMSESVDDLLVVARSGINAVELIRRPVPLRPEVNMVLDSVVGAREKLGYTEVHGVVMGDRMRIRQIIRHLVRNAVEHGGPHLRISAHLHGDQVVLSVDDDGPPLSAEECERIFDPYYQRKRRPTGTPLRGIGLTASRFLARAMGGDIVFRADPSGNTVELWLPAEPVGSEHSTTGLIRRGLRRAKQTPVEAGRGKPGQVAQG